MSYNFVEVVVNVVLQDGSTVLPSGTLHFQPSDFIWDTTAGNVVVGVPIDLTGNGNYALGTTIPLLAMDNPTLSTNWSWLLTPALPDVSNLPTRKLTVNYASGASQQLSDLLAASTLV